MKKIISFMLAVLLSVSCLNVSAFADTSGNFGDGDSDVSHYGDRTMYYYSASDSESIIDRARTRLISHISDKSSPFPTDFSEWGCIVLKVNYTVNQPNFSSYVSECYERYFVYFLDVEFPLDPPAGYIYPCLTSDGKFKFNGLSDLCKQKNDSDGLYHYLSCNSYEDVVVTDKCPYEPFTTLVKHGSCCAFPPIVNLKSGDSDATVKLIYSDYDIVDDDGVEVDPEDNGKFKCWVSSSDDKNIEFNAEFYQNGNYELFFGAFNNEGFDGHSDYIPCYGFPRYPLINNFISSMMGDNMSTVLYIDNNYFTSDFDYEKPLNLFALTYTLDLNYFYDVVQDDDVFKSAENIYFQIYVVDKDDGSYKSDYISLPKGSFPNGSYDPDKDPSQNGLFGDKKDFIDFPSLEDFIDTDFPDIRDFIDFDAFSNMQFVDVGGIDLVIDVLKNTWVVLKTTFFFIYDNFTGFFKWLWACLKFIWFNLVDLFKYLGSVLWVIIQNIGVALYNLAVDIRRLLVFLFVPGSGFFNSYVGDFKKTLSEKFGIVGEVKLFFENLVKNFSGDCEAPVWHFTLFGKTCTFIDFSAFDKYRSLVHNVILAIAWVRFLKKVVVSTPSILAGSNVEFSDSGIDVNKR